MTLPEQTPHAIYQTQEEGPLSRGPDAVLDLGKKTSMNSSQVQISLSFHNTHLGTLRTILLYLQFKLLEREGIQRIQNRLSD